MALAFAIEKKETECAIVCMRVYNFHFRFCLKLYFYSMLLLLLFSFNISLSYRIQRRWRQKWNTMFHRHFINKITHICSSPFNFSPFKYSLKWFFFLPDFGLHLSRTHLNCIFELQTSTYKKKADANEIEIVWHSVCHFYDRNLLFNVFLTLNHWQDSSFNLSKWVLICIKILDI